MKELNYRILRKQRQYVKSYKYFMVEFNNAPAKEI